METKIAKIISRLFDVYTIAPLSVFAISVKLLQMHGNLDTIVRWDVLLLLVYFLVPVIGLLILLDMHKVTDWDMTNRTQRIPIQIFIMLMYLALFAVTIIFDAPTLFKAYAFINYIIMFCLLEVTEYWKISMHAAMITSFAVLVTMLFGIYGIFLFLLIPVVYWSRIVLGKHTMNQLLAGSLVAASSTVIILKIFNF